MAEESKILYQPLTHPLLAQPGNRVVTADLLLTIPNKVDNPTINWLDQSHLVYSMPLDNRNGLSEIGLIDINKKNKKQLDNGLLPRPSPNGKWIAYIREANGKKQLWIMSPNGERKQLTKLANGLTGGVGYHYDFAWSPNSEQLALFYQPEVEDWARVKKVTKDPSKSSAVSYGNLLEPLPKTTILIINISNSQLRTIANVDAKIRYISWLPNGKALLFSEEREARRYSQKEDRNWIKKMDVQNGKEQIITEIKGLQQFLSPVASPDGKEIAFTYDPYTKYFSVLSNIGIVTNTTLSGSTSTASIKQLTEQLKLFSPQWSPDGKSIYVRRNYGAYDQIYEVSTISGAATQITNSPLKVGSFRLSQNGKQLAWIGEDAHANCIVQISQKDGSSISTLLRVPKVSKEVALSEVREIEWSSPTYPVPMRGLLVLPLHYHAGKRYPLITDIHGGDIGANIYLEGGVLVCTPLEWQLWAAKGYAVFVPEFRSSGSFGSLAITRDELKDHDLVNRDMQDVLSGIDALIAKGVADNSRLAVIGHSAGARRVNWLAVKTHCFKAIVSKEGWVDEWLLAGIDPINRVTEMFGGAPVMVPENYQKNSALFHAKGATTPTLFLMGSTEKGIDNYNIVRWLYHALQAQGVETQYIQYPDEGHVFERPANRKDVLERVIKWLDIHFSSQKKIHL